MLVVLIALVSACAQRARPHGEELYDIVLANGRVIDPASGLDGVRNVGLRGGQIAAIGVEPLAGRQTVDVSGLVVAPGFIDLHAHGQETSSAWLQARDGVTTALDMELGVFPVGEWYASRAGTSPINYGAAVGHIPARIKVKLGLDVGHRPTNLAFSEQLHQQRAWAYDTLAPDEMQKLVDVLDAGLRDGAPGIGLAINYTPAAGRTEVWRVFQLGAARGAPLFIHLRFLGPVEPGSGIEALQEVLADAAATGAAVHVLHVTSMGLAQTPTLLAMIEGARQRGVDVSVEAYPYTAASTGLTSALFDPGWQERMGISYGDLQWTATGERLTKATFERYRKHPGGVIVHMIPQAAADQAVAHPLVMIASDGLPFRTGGEHPRGAGTFARVLGYYVRERGALSLTDALRKMTIMPAHRLESYVPQMRHKGRLQVGADADITVFDPRRVRDRATYEHPMQPSEGIAHVLVGGVFVVRDAAPVADALPGRPVRNPIAGVASQ